MSDARLLDSLAVLNSRLKLKELVPAVLDSSLELTGADRAFLILCDRTGQLSIKAGRGQNNEDLCEADFEGSTTILNKVLQDKQTLYVPRIQGHQDLAGSKSVRKLSLMSAICIPLWRNTDLMGLLYIDSSSPVYELRQEHLPLMQALANHAAIAIEHARLFEELEEKNQEIAVLNEKLKGRVEAQEGNLIEMKALLEETQRALGRQYALGNLIGSSESMLEVFKVLKRVVGTTATVLITGESGTGKELVARFIHNNGPRSDKPLISINCPAFNDTLLESELFGHRKGAFTGASENKIGLFQLADQGTLFLDEIGEMSPDMQKKLLRVLEDGEVRPVGSSDTHTVDVRILAATNRDLGKMVKEGKYRQDLYYRLHVISIKLPPLRRRCEDIPLLIDFYSKRISDELQLPLKKIPEPVRKRFTEYTWPGNVRELVNELRRFYILDSEYRLEHLQSVAELDDGLDLATVEKKAILKALAVCGGNKSKASELLGIPRTSFYDKLSKYGIS